MCMGHSNPDSLPLTPILPEILPYMRKVPGLVFLGWRLHQLRRFEIGSRVVARRLSGR